MQSNMRVRLQQADIHGLQDVKKEYRDRLCVLLWLTHLE
jgi:hypothetical protein